MERSNENDRWLYESLVPPHIVDPKEREAYIQKLMNEGVRSTGQESGEKLEYFSD